MGQKKQRDSTAPGTKTSEDLSTHIARDTQAYAMLGLRLGVGIILAGVVLLVLGVSGAVDITFQAGKAKGHLVTGALGIVIALVGVAIVFLTKPRLEAEQGRIIRRRARPGR